MHDNGIHTALMLVSGGLDSQLAVCVLRNAGVRVQGIVFESPFFEAGRGRDACQRLGIPYHMHNFLPDIIDVINNPRHGFGPCMNPCIDCHARMLKRAGEMLPELGCHFLATGEVLDERPFSQSLRSLDHVASDSGFAHLVLRPLSAKHLEPTLPEVNGWIDRHKLLDLKGRSRKRQFALADEFGLVDYPAPAGGCRLTEPQFCDRLRDMIAHEGLAGERDIGLLRVGRHFRIGPKTRLIVGRDASDNAAIEAARELYDIIMKVENVPGPSALIPVTASEDEAILAASICASYSDSPRDGTVTLKLKSSRGERRMSVKPASRARIESLRV